MIDGSIHWEQLETLFSVVLQVDENLRIVRQSGVSQRYMGELNNVPSLIDLFTIKRPSSIRSFADIQAHNNALFLLLAKDNRFAIRGQFIDASPGNDKSLLFLGAPWLSWLQTNRPDLSLGLSDFTPQDAQLDQMFYISTENRMVQDLERLNQQLKATTEKLEVAQAAKDAFFAKISHEMRTPLNGVVSAIALLESHPLPNDSHHLVELAKESSQNLMHVINYVLDIAKIEDFDSRSDRERAEIVPFDLHQLASHAIDIIAAKAMEKNLTVTSMIDPSLGATYLCDVSALRQTLLNLLINAVNYTVEGGVQLHIYPSRKPGMDLRFEVRDTGVGIAVEHQTRIFEPFARVPAEGVSNVPAGTGLGLDIVRRNVGSLGGRVGVKSVPGQGATFWVEIPCEAVEDKAVPVDDSAPRTTAPERFVGRVLLVDDNTTNLMLGGMLLENLGLDVTQATSGEDAVSRALESRFDLVFMDINMPGMDGHQATEEIRRHASAEQLPIIALSAHTSAEDRRRSAAAGMNDYLTKPIERQKLAEVLRGYLAIGQDSIIETTPTTNEDVIDVIDYGIIQQLQNELGQDNFDRVMTAFLEEIDQRWSALETATEVDSQSREAHTLASTCRSFGLIRAADQFKDIENTARFEKTLAPTTTLRQASHDLAEAISALNAFNDAIGTEHR